jgi:ribosomal protein S18 acetylase RimI-like enzyme
MQAVETFARERSAAGITLNVFAHNDCAIRLYERLEAAKGGQCMRKQL